MGLSPLGIGSSGADAGGSRHRRIVMKLELSVSEAEELKHVLDEVISDMSSEIANTDNPTFREALKQRRDLLSGIRTLVGAAEGART
jgi:hypothetical protein